MQLDAAFGIPHGICLLTKDTGTSAAVETFGGLLGPLLASGARISISGACPVHMS